MTPPQPPEDAGARRYTQLSNSGTLCHGAAYLARIPPPHCPSRDCGARQSDGNLGSTHDYHLVHKNRQTRPPKHTYGPELGLRRLRRCRRQSDTALIFVFYSALATLRERSLIWLVLASTPRIRARRSVLARREAPPVAMDVSHDLIAEADEQKAQVRAVWRQ